MSSQDPKTVRFQISLDLLGYPDSVLASGRTYSKDVPFDYLLKSARAVEGKRKSIKSIYGLCLKVKVDSFCCGWVDGFGYRYRRCRDRLRN